MENLFFDGEYYYFFRSFNTGDMRDYEAGSKTIKTDAMRYSEANGRFGKYNSNDTMSTEEVYDHIKMRYLRETNCISLSIDPNVSLTYHDYRKYAIVKVKKEDFEKNHVINAGDYFRESLDSIIDNAVRKITDSKILEDIARIERAQTVDEVSDALVACKIGKSNTVLRKRKYLDDAEQIKMVKTLAKFKYLERNKIIDRIIPNAVETEGNNTYLNAMGMAYTSGEHIHYGEIGREEFFDCPAFFIDALALIEQAKKNGVSMEDINRIRGKIFNLVTKGYNVDAISKSFCNEKEKIMLSNDVISLLTGEYLDRKELQQKITLENALDFASKGYTYSEIKTKIPAIQLLAECKLKQRAIADTLGMVLPGENVEQVLDNTICINRDVANRSDGNGYPITNLVNIVVEGKNYTMEPEKIKYVLAKLNQLSNEELTNVIKNGIDSPYIEDLLNSSKGKNKKVQQEKSNGIDTEFILDAMMDECKRDCTKIDTKHRVKLTEKLLRGRKDSTSLINMYNVLKDMEFSKSRKYRDDEIFAIIINLSLTDKLGEHTYEELLKSNPESLKQILHTNKDELQRRVVTAESDFFGEKGNDRDKGDSKENGESKGSKIMKKAVSGTKQQGKLSQISKTEQELEELQGIEKTI